MRRLLFTLALGVLSLMTSVSAQAQGFSITISLDEFGNGHLSNTAGFNSSLPSGFLSDPGPGGLGSALTYGLLNPPGLTAGDILIRDPVTSALSDLLRFNSLQSCFGSTGCLVAYSALGEGAPADTGFPTAEYTNVLTLIEGLNGVVTFTPTAGQPGFVTGAAGPVTYVFTSTVPEPASLAILGVALVAIGGARRRIRRG